MSYPTFTGAPFGYAPVPSAPGPPAFHHGVHAVPHGMPQGVPQGVPLAVPQDVTQTVSQESNHSSQQQTHSIIIRQQPQTAKVVHGKEKDRKPVDPPPILQLTVDRRADPQQNFLQSPYYFMSCTLVRDKGDDNEDNEEPEPNAVVGTVVSSLHRLKDADNTDGGFFVFGDLSVKKEGTWRLQFTLYNMEGLHCVYITSITSQPFVCHTGKTFPGMAESTFLTRSFSDQGVRLRLRKDSRTITTRKRNNAAAEFARQNSTHDRKQEEEQQQARRTNSWTEGPDPLTPIERVRGPAGPTAPAYFDSHGLSQGDYSRASGGGYGYGYEDGPPTKRQRMQPGGSNHAYKQDYTPYTTQAMPHITAQVSSGLQHYPNFSMPPSLPTTSLSIYSPSSMARLTPQMNAELSTPPLSSHITPQLSHQLGPHQLNTQMGQYHPRPESGDDYTPRQSPSGAHQGSYSSFDPAVNPPL